MAAAKAIVSPINDNAGEFFIVGDKEMGKGGDKRRQSSLSLSPEGK